MTQEEKQLLLTDLCARLPYGVCIAKGNIIYPLTEVNIALGYVELAVSERISIEDAKPYLRPMSSMTEEEENEYETKIRGSLVSYLDWLNTHHFDYRGLIEKGLALEAPEGMYNL